MSRLAQYPAEVREPMAMRLDLVPAQGDFSPLQTLLGRFTWDSSGREGIRAIEISVLWHTEGKGDEDMEVHYFRRISVDSPDGNQLDRPIEFGVKLPPSPLSYEGQIMKIRWCARARVFPHKGNQVVLERRFFLKAPLA